MVRFFGALRVKKLFLIAFSDITVSFQVQQLSFYCVQLHMKAMGRIDMKKRKNFYHPCTER